ncbi:MAG: serine/threonine-protein kinase [Planctomycetota bacterium]
MSDRDVADTVSPDDEEITNLVDAAMQAHLEGGDSGLEQFCQRLDRHRDAVLRRLSALCRVGLFGDAAPAATPLPERLGDFELLEPLGRGGMGVVYRARQVSLDREVAVKLIRPEQIWFPGVRERFRREIGIVAKLQNEGVVRLYEFGEDRSIPWFAMELIRGASLAHLIETLAKKQGQPTAADLAQCLGTPPGGLTGQLFVGGWADVAVRIVERVAQALDEAHQQGVLHRDIKPSNIMITASGRVVLLDFGLAWSHDADRLTRSGSELGTIHYMAPEQFAGAKARVDERTDIYSLGVVLRELVTLRSVFTGSTVDEVARQVREGRHSPFAGRRSSVARDVETVCLVAMDRDPQRRYPSARLFARDLRCVLERRPIEAVRPGLGLRLRRFAQRHRTVSIAIAVAVVALLFTPLAVALHERELRQQLEATNQSLVAEVARADRNLGLATGAIEETLTRLGEERVSVVPDLRAFVNRALASSATFIDGLASGNPADPAARLRLAQSLAKVAFVQWSFFNLERTEPLFLRTLQLLQGAEATTDAAAELELQVRLALVYVQRLDPVASIGAYREALARARAAGPVEGRSLQLRTLVAQCLDRCGGILRRRGDGAGTPMIEEAARLREGVAQVAPSAEAWVEVALSASTLAGECHKAGDAQGAARHEGRLDDALAAVGKLAATLSLDDGERFLSVLVQRANALTSQPARRIELLERAERLLHESLVRRPSRLSELYSWIGVAWRLVEAYEQVGRVPEAFAVARQANRRARAALVMWSQEFGTMRCSMQNLRWLAQMARRHPGAAGELDVDQLLDEAVAITAQAEFAEPRRTVTFDECNRVLAERARHRLQSGRVEAALADAVEAERFYALAGQRAQDEKVGLGEDFVPCLLQGEALLRLQRDDEALARLHRVGRFPRGVLELVPTLATRERDPRFAPLVERARREN